VETRSPGEVFREAGIQGGQKRRDPWKTTVRRPSPSLRTASSGRVSRGKKAAVGGRGEGSPWPLGGRGNAGKAASRFLSGVDTMSRSEKRIGLNEETSSLQATDQREELSSISYVGSSARGVGRGRKMSLKRREELSMGRNLPECPPVIDKKGRKRRSTCGERDL